MTLPAITPRRESTWRAGHGRRAGRVWVLVRIDAGGAVLFPDRSTATATLPVHHHGVRSVPARGLPIRVKDSDSLLSQSLLP